MIIVTRVAQFIRRSKLWRCGTRSITPATLRHAITTCHTFVIFLMYLYLSRRHSWQYYGESLPREVQAKARSKHVVIKRRTYLNLHAALLGPCHCLLFGGHRFSQPRVHHIVVLELKNRHAVPFQRAKLSLHFSYSFDRAGIPHSYHGYERYSIRKEVSCLR